MIKISVSSSVRSSAAAKNERERESESFISIYIPPPGNIPHVVFPPHCYNAPKSLFHPPAHFDSSIRPMLGNRHRSGKKNIMAQFPPRHGTNSGGLRETHSARWPWRTRDCSSRRGASFVTRSSATKRKENIKTPNPYSFMRDDAQDSFPSVLALASPKSPTRIRFAGPQGNDYGAESLH